MADAPETPKKNVASGTAAVVGGVSPLALLLSLPQPYAGWAAIAFAVLAGAGLAATQITLPTNQSGKLWMLYRAINFLAMNWKQAANAAVLLRSSIPAKAEAVKAGPGSVVTIKQEKPQ